MLENIETIVEERIKKVDARKEREDLESREAYLKSLKHRINKFFTYVSRADVPKEFETENYIWKRFDEIRYVNHGIESVHTVIYRIQSKETMILSLFVFKREVPVEKYVITSLEMDYDHFCFNGYDLWCFDKHNLTKELFQKLIEEFSIYLETL